MIGVTFFTSASTDMVFSNNFGVIFKKEMSSTSSSQFTLSSPVMNDYDFISDNYTCEALPGHHPLIGIVADNQNNPPLMWNNPPENTVDYFLTLSSRVVNIDMDYMSYDMCVWNISKDSNYLPEWFGTGYDGARFWLVFVMIDRIMIFYSRLNVVVHILKLLMILIHGIIIQNITSIHLALLVLDKST